MGLLIGKSTVTVTFAHQAKGTLVDLFEATQHINWDWFFKRSLIMDIGEGLSFLHTRTELFVHGNLSSYTCLVSDRWQASEIT